MDFIESFHLVVALIKEMPGEVPPRQCRLLEIKDTASNRKCHEFREKVKDSRILKHVLQELPS